MVIRSYNSELAIANLMFARIFSNIMIERTLSGGEKKLIKVNCVFGQRSRILKSLQNPDRKGMIKYPIIAINRQGYSRNPDRLNNLHNEIKRRTSEKEGIPYDLLTPVPIDIDYEVYVASKYPSDIDQIASNFMVFFNGDVYVACQHPKLDQLSLKNQVVLENSITEEHPDELANTDNDFIVSTFLFKFKTYLFGGTEKYSLSSNISTYVSTYISMVPSVILSTLVEQELSTLVSVEVPPPTGEPPYYPIEPTISSIKAGFYPICLSCDPREEITRIDSQYTDETEWPYVDRLIWTIS